jgi:hypothetical protein
VKTTATVVREAVTVVSATVPLVKAIATPVREAATLVKAIVPRVRGIATSVMMPDSVGTGA